MEQIPDHPVFARSVLEMITVANDYCMTLKKVETLSKRKLLDYVTKVSPLLYLKGALLPETPVNQPDMNERFYTEEEWENLFNAMRKILGNDDVFWYADPELSDELVKGSLSEHMTDVFQDMEDFLLLYQKNSLYSKENAVHELGKLFISNWGKKLLRMMPHVHMVHFATKQSDNGEDLPSIF